MGGNRPLPLKSLSISLASKLRPAKNETPPESNSRAT